MMDDKQFAELSLRSSLCPSLETQWDKPDTYQHWSDLHAAAHELRNVIGHVRAGVQAIEADRDLTPDARKRKRHELARQAMSELEKIKSVEKAQASVAAITKRWQTKIDSVMTKPEPEDAATALLLREVRDKVANLKDERARMAWLQRFGDDPIVASALLLGPAGLTNLSEAERVLLTNKVEALADPKIVEAKFQATKALAELERSYRAAPDLVAQCAGLDKASAARPLSRKSELPNVTAPKGEPPKDTPPKAAEVSPPVPEATPKAASPNWPSKKSSSPATAGGPNWT